ncbi:hypothetical protein PL9214640122 [Planktothrix tepida PCC 9214]|uniref:Transmembrane protein n=1 Tax=Planktothrix tepida PCC 9214 TaxID=671072 RepID=A0A1J1LNP1_9CYAN|nr:hypothetical protein PL9214640122 [Planktothrix tepida PCC 9214]
MGFVVGGNGIFNGFHGCFPIYMWVELCWCNLLIAFSTGGELIAGSWCRRILVNWLEIRVSYRSLLTSDYCAPAMRAAPPRTNTSSWAVISVNKALLRISLLVLSVLLVVAEFLMVFMGAFLLR